MISIGSLSPESSVLARPAASDSSLLEQRGRPLAPALPVAAAICLGILIDRLTDFGNGTWLGACGVCLGAGFCAERRGAARLATVLLLLACVCLGGARHHFRWSTVAANDIGRFATFEPSPVRLVGVIASPISIHGADHSHFMPPWMQLDRSQCDVNCERLSGQSGEWSTRGRVRLIARGHLLHASVGDRIEIVGQFSRPQGAQNPGGFDYREYLRRSGIHCVVSVDHPDAVHIMERRAGSYLARLRTELRSQCETVFVTHLSRSSVPLAISLILGERSQLPEETREAFIASGATHILAISGLHVSILAALVLFLCRILKASVLTSTIAMLVVIGGYAFITNHNPPVIRASVFAVAVAAGWPWFRRAGGLNLLAVCAAIVLMINPCDLFDVGAQLSFLSVAAIGAAMTWLGHVRSRSWRSPFLAWMWDPNGSLLQYSSARLLEGCILTLAIAIVTAPLIAARLHLVSIVGLALNLVLVPLSTLLLWAGFLTAASGLLIPQVAAVPAIIFDGLLYGLQWIVEQAAELRLGHLDVAGPSGAWLAVYYILLGSAALIPRSQAARRWAWRAAALWMVVGLLTPFLPASRQGLRCTFLSMGHGCAAVLEMPDGETLLYDAGTLGDPRRGQSVIQNALWSRGITRLDGIVISHADLDHFNAAAGLMESMPVGSLLCGQAFLDFAQPSVAALCETASRRNVPVRLLQSEDRILLSNGTVEMTILHPPPHWRSDEDNANSIVMKVKYAGRTILLTGDLEQDGLRKLLECPAESVDVLLSPHHGSRSANPAELDRWASPRFVVVSGGVRNSDVRLRSTYSTAERILSTHESGAVTIYLSPNGEVDVSTWLNSE